MKKRKLKIFNLFIVIAITAVVLLSIFKVFDIIVENIANHNEKPNPNNDVTEKYDKFSMNLVDYEVYKIDEVDFNFVLARFKMCDKKTVKYSLSDLYTDEKIKCNTYETYVKELESKSYYLGSKNVNYTINSDKNSGIFKIFIPIKDKSKTSIVLYDVVSKSEFTIDLTKNIGNNESLKFSTGGNIDNHGYNIKIADAYIETKLMTKEGPYQYPSTVQIYTFTLNVEDVTQENIRLEQAIFEMDNGEVVEANPIVYSKKMNNGINKTIHAGDKLGLFFEVINPNSEIKSFNGTLKIKFSSSEEWLQIETELK